MLKNKSENIEKIKFPNFKFINDKNEENEKK